MTQTFFSNYSIVILISSILVMILWVIWYSPYVFWKTWLRLHWLSNQDPTAGHIILTFVWSVWLSIFTILLYSFIGVNNYGDALYVWLFIWLFCVVPVISTHYIYTNGSIRLFLIEAWYQILSVILIGFIYVLL